MKSLIGKPVSLTISEPWDFGAVHGNGPFSATVVDVTRQEGTTGGALLVRLEKPLWFQGNFCEHLIATPAAGGNLEKLEPSESLNCRFVSISPQGARSASPFDLTWWRGWGALRGVIQAAWLEGSASPRGPSLSS
jgi:hypothetical protein